MVGRIVFVLAAALVLAAPTWAQEAVKVGDNLVEIKVVGAGMSKEQALRDAQRKAVEQGAGTYIHSQSETKDFALVRDTILTKSTGFLKSFKITREKEMEDGTWEVGIDAEVSVQGIVDMWGTVTTMLQRVGRPKIMVFIDEKIGPEQIEDSTVQTCIEQALLKSGFLLVDKKQLKEIDRKDLQSAAAEDSPAKVQAIAKRFGAQLFITGSAHAQHGDSKLIGGVHLYTAEAEANVRTFRSDTGQLISAIPGVPQRGVQQVARSAAKQALDAEGKSIAPEVAMNILDHWQEALSGRGELKLEIENVKFGDMDKIETALKKLKEVKDVNSDFHNGVAEMSVQAEVVAKDLAKAISKALPMIEITDVSDTVIKAKFVGEK